MYIEKTKRLVYIIKSNIVMGKLVAKRKEP